MKYNQLEIKEFVKTSRCKSENKLLQGVLDFLDNTCEDLRYDATKAAEEKKTGKFFGTSIEPNQIPYNMQMDIDRLCLSNAFARFLKSGTAEDAFDVYVCYIEMFWGSYGKSRHVVEMLSEFESNGSALLMKHRDHYSHSVYVFAIGLAIYENNSAYRKAYADYYDLDSDSTEAAHHYLEFWGMSALFHDIGYPFELPFEEVCSYFETNRKEGDGGSANLKKTNRSTIPFIAYHDMEKYVTLPESDANILLSLYNLKKDASYFSTIDDIFAYNLENKLGDIYWFTKESLAQVLAGKPHSPERFGHFMDHAYFSAVTLFRELRETITLAAIKKEHIDALTAILLHNSLYKFSIGFITKKGEDKRFRMQYHPLAYMLMLCDELQCWDRTAYGRNSKIQLHPMDCEFAFTEKEIHVSYAFDEAEKAKIDTFHKKLNQYIKNGGKEEERPTLKAYENFVYKAFQEDIEKIVDCKNDGLLLKVHEPVIRPAEPAKKSLYLSNSSFLHLYNFATALNGRYEFFGENSEEISDDCLYGAFEKKSLEYKLSNISQAKAFAEYLDAIGCFYTDRPVVYDFVDDFSKEELERIGVMEHGRWLREKQEMGWKYGTSYKDRDERERRRIHKLALDIELTVSVVNEHFNALPKDEKEKDYAPMVLMLKLIKKFDGLRIYRYKEC